MVRNILINEGLAVRYVCDQHGCTRSRWERPTMTRRPAVIAKSCRPPRMRAEIAAGYWARNRRVRSCALARTTSNPESALARGSCGYGPAWTGRSSRAKKRYFYLVKQYAEVVTMWSHKFSSCEIAIHLGIPEPVIAQWIANYQDMKHEAAA